MANPRHTIMLDVQDKAAVSAAKPRCLHPDRRPGQRPASRLFDRRRSRSRRLGHHGRYQHQRAFYSTRAILPQMVANGSGP